LQSQKRGLQNGKQRYFCKQCNFSFLNIRDDVKANNEFIWFKKWIIERQIYKYLVRDSGYSQSKIQRIFHHYLKTVPVVEIRSKSKVHLLIDGSYFSNGLCLVLYFDHDLKYVQLYRETDQERFTEIKEDLLNLKKLGVDVYSVTCDGHKAILKSVQKVFPNAIIQRCLVHIKRQVRNYLSSRPKLEQSASLLKLSNQITSIKTIEDSGKWLVSFYNWHLQNSDFINQQTQSDNTGRYWYTHKNLHAAFSLIENAIPNMFNYLDDNEIPYTTNRIENYFTHLKDKLSVHRGLRFEAKKNFIKWYLYMKNNPDRFF
jgi:hypothetical protein